MAQVRSWAGLDVHAAKVLAATMDSRSGELVVRRLPGATGEVVAFCAGLPGPVRVAYEAGPTGFGLARALEAAGVGCIVAAPGKIERPASDRVKTDRRDAERLLRLLMIGGRPNCRALMLALKMACAPEQSMNASSRKSSTTSRAYD
jgi:transposase